jgi:sugar/nucleoside kinase (ribokinase family)
VLAADNGRDHLLKALADVPELLLTLGFRGAEIRTGATADHVSPDRVITDVQTTGAGDAFMIAYLVGRHRGAAPTAAAGLAADVTAAMLAERKQRG